MAALLIFKTTSRAFTLPLVLRIGNHTLMITDEDELTLETTEYPVTETVCLDSEETYRLYMSLHTLFQCTEA